MPNWTGPGLVGQMFHAVVRRIAPSGMPPPWVWVMSLRFARD